MQQGILLLLCVTLPSSVYDTTNSTQLKDLLTLKQQQAGVIEAREAVKQGQETLRQGKSIILFTVVTIVFVCLPSPTASLNFPPS